MYQQISPIAKGRVENSVVFFMRLVKREKNSGVMTVRIMGHCSSGDDQDGV